MRARTWMAAGGAMLLVAACVHSAGTTAGDAAAGGSPHGAAHGAAAGYGSGQGPGQGPGPGTQAGMHAGMQGGMQAGMGRGMGRMMEFGPHNAAGWSLMTTEERKAHRDKMQSFKSYEECKAYMEQHAKQMAERAKEKGVAHTGPRENACDMMKSHGAFK